MKKNLRKELCDFLDGWMDISGADDMPDGAWQAMCEEGVEAFNQEYGTHIDTNDGFHAWVGHPWKGEK